MITFTEGIREWKWVEGGWVDHNRLESMRPRTDESYLGSNGSVTLRTPYRCGARRAAPLLSFSRPGGGGGGGGGGVRGPPMYRHGPAGRSRVSPSTHHSTNTL